MHSDQSQTNHVLGHRAKRHIFRNCFGVAEVTGRQVSVHLHLLRLMSYYVLYLFIAACFLQEVEGARILLFLMLLIWLYRHFYSHTVTLRVHLGHLDDTWLGLAVNLPGPVIYFGLLICYHGYMVEGKICWQGWHILNFYVKGDIY